MKPKEEKNNIVSIEAFNIEKDAKNNAYFFILSHGLFDCFSNYCKNVQIKNPHEACVNILKVKELLGVD